MNAFHQLSELIKRTVTEMTNLTMPKDPLRTCTVSTILLHTVMPII